MNPLSEEDYKKNFTSKEEKALEHALDIRKFEIELYWKRAAYFWTFIAATLAGYGAIQASSMVNKDDFSVVLSCLGIVFSVGWFCVNKGSKQWQENWENHVDILEDDVLGPLYKVILKRPKPKGVKEHLRQIITGPSPFSVSKINQIISFYVMSLWVFLLYKSLPPFSLSAPINWEYVSIISATTIIIILFFKLGKTHEDDYEHIAIKRDSIIINHTQQESPKKHCRQSRH